MRDSIAIGAKNYIGLRSGGYGGFVAYHYRNSHPAVLNSFRWAAIRVEHSGGVQRLWVVEDEQGD